MIWRGKQWFLSLFGYLDAVENGLVAGEEKEAYIHVAVEKACHLKHFVEALFEWVKLVLYPVSF